MDVYDDFYPDSSGQRLKWIVNLREPKNKLNPWQAYAYHNEKELSPDLDIVDTSVIFLTNRECPWHCVMCDLWKNTLETNTPAGAIPHQIELALKNLPEASQVKLYNSGSFFDHKAIPVEDYPDIAKLLSTYQRVIVESHPKLIGEDTLRFRDMLNGKLEVAMGLETVQPTVLEKLNKGVTLDNFREAAEFLRDNDIDLRVFILVKPPFMNEKEGLKWACKSLDFAFDVGATVAILIPTRGGNGAMENLREQGFFSPPKIHTLEKALDHGIKLGKGRVFADLWDLEQFSDCPVCFAKRKKRLENINFTQRLFSYPVCEDCDYIRIDKSNDNNIRISK